MILQLQKSLYRKILFIDTIIMFSIYRLIDDASPFVDQTSHVLIANILENTFPDDIFHL